MTTRVRLPLIAAALVVACAALLARSALPDFATVRARWQPSEAVLLDRAGVRLDGLRIDYGVRRFDWIALDALSPRLVEAIVAAEDRRFWSHGGVDWRAALGAVRDNLTGRHRRGASTITMQLATLVDPALSGHRRDAVDKVRQMLDALRIERTWAKREILEAYVNLLTFRGELQGIDAASRLLAGKRPSALTAAESAVLAALLPSPSADAAHVAERACARVRADDAGADCGPLAQLTQSMLRRAARMPSERGSAPELAQLLLSRAGERVTTTLDANVQVLARDVLERRLRDLGQRNVRDGAALVVDNATGDELPHVCSAGPESRARHVDGVRAHRQAGSTLKSFLYALALERRYLTNASLLDDSPISLDTATGVYLPQNYDRDFKGLVSVRTALGSSLNIPAVRALVLVGVDAFVDRLNALGYEGIDRDGAFYGYSLALGSADVSLWEQVRAYRVLANGGFATPLRLRPNDPTEAPRRVVPRDAAFLVTDVLGDRTARVATFGLDSVLNTAVWSAVKTGTSKDMRDNWCLGFTQRFTVGVWVGNFEGDSMHDVSGVAGAAPAWHDIVAALHEHTPSDSPTPPVGVTRAAVAFEPAVEPPRQEWFAAGTELARVVTVPPHAVRTRIASPGNGLVIALDPDIPSARQRIPLLARGDTRALEFRIDDETVGPADARALWAPRRGAHRLALVDGAGTVVDQVLFTVR